jgi:hypothetical protein
MKQITIALISLIVLMPNAIALPSSEQAKIAACAKTGQTNSSPINKVVIQAKVGDFYQLSVGKKNEPGWEMILKLNPCRLVYLNPMGDPYSQYGVKDLPNSVIDAFESKRVANEIKKQGREAFFSSIINSAQNGVLEFPPETEKALIGQGFKLPSGVRIVHPTIPMGGE